MPARKNKKGCRHSNAEEPLVVTNVREKGGDELAPGRPRRRRAAGRGASAHETRRRAAALGPGAAALVAALL